MAHPDRPVYPPYLSESERRILDRATRDGEKANKRATLAAEGANRRSSILAVNVFNRLRNKMELETSGGKIIAGRCREI